MRGLIQIVAFLCIIIFMLGFFESAIGGTINTVKRAVYLKTEYEKVEVK